MIIGLMGQARVGKDTAGAVIASVLGGTTLAFADPIKRWCLLALRMREEQLWGDEKEKPFTKAWLKQWNKQSRWGVDLADDGTTWTNLLADACCVPPYQRGIVGARAYATLRWWVNHDIELEMWRWWENIRREDRLTPRRVMQHFGTELIRQRLGPHFWIDNGMRIADQLLEGGKVYMRTKGVVASEANNLNAAVFTDVRFRNEAIALRRRGALLYGIERPNDVNQRQHDKMKSDVRRVKGKIVELARHASELEQLSVPQFWLDGRFQNRGTKEEFEHAVRYIARNHLATRGPVVY